MVEDNIKRPDVFVDKERVLVTVKRASEARENREGIFACKVRPPEEKFIDRVKTYGQEQCLDNFALHALFFTITTLFADNSTKQLNGINKRFDPQTHARIFIPRVIVESREEDVVETARDLIRPSVNDIAIHKWFHNAKLLCDKYDGDLKNFFSGHQNEAPAILAGLTGPKRKEGWEGFHRFGPKIGRLFLQWVGQYDLAEITKVDEIGIPVDFQVARLVIQTGGVKLTEATHKHWILEQQLVPLFEEICKENGLSSARVSETLWLIGSECCNSRLHHLCPLSSLCDRLISRSPLDAEGIFDPDDVGRWRGRPNPKAEEKRQKASELGQREFQMDIP